MKLRAILCLGIFFLIGFLYLPLAQDVLADVDTLNTKLREAIEQKDKEKIAKLLKKGANINHVDTDGNSALKLMVFSGELEMVKYLLSAGADVDVKDAQGNTVLSLLSCFGYGNGFKQQERDILRLLIGHNADVNVNEGAGASPLHLASLEGHKEIVQELLLNNAHVNSKVGSRDIDHHYSLKQECNKYFGKPYTLFGISHNIEIPEGSTAIHLAARNGHAEIIQRNYPFAGPPVGCPPVSRAAFLMRH